MYYLNLVMPQCSCKSLMKAMNNQLIINLGFVEKALQDLVWAGWWHTIPATKLDQQKNCGNRCHQDRFLSFQIF